jgi:tetratricopeptide (TPR) repeat protein
MDGEVIFKFELLIFSSLFAFFAEIYYNMCMRQKRGIFLALLLGFLLFPAFAQETPASQYIRRFQNGAQLYGLSRWQEAAIEFRRAQEIAQNIEDWSAALYWVTLSQLAYSDYGSALRDMEQLERYAPNSPYARDMVYHRARVYFLLGYFEEALILFNRYNASTTDSDPVTSDRRAAAFFWIGESLYAMRQLDEAEKFYAWVITRYPQSPKIEASSYRLDLIKQKKIETELLALLQLSHEEALRTSEEYQRTIRTYEHTLNVYQRRIAELTAAQTRSENNANQNIPQTQQEEIIIQNENRPDPVVPPETNEDTENTVVPDTVSQRNIRGVTR